LHRASRPLAFVVLACKALDRSLNTYDREDRSSTTFATYYATHNNGVLFLGKNEIGADMRGLNLTPVLSLSVVLLCTNCLQAQQVTTPAGLPNAPSAVAATIRLHVHSELWLRNLPFKVNQTQGTVESWTRLFGGKALEGLYPSGMSTLGKGWDKDCLKCNEPYLIGSVQSARVTFTSINGPAQPTTPRVKDEWEHLAHQIRGVDLIVTQLGQQAKTHPRVTTVLKLVRPQF